MNQPVLLDVVHALATGGVDYAVIGAWLRPCTVSTGEPRCCAVLSVDPREAVGCSAFWKPRDSSRVEPRGCRRPIAALLRISDNHDNRVDLLLGLRGMEPGAFSRVVVIPFQAHTEVHRPRGFHRMKAFAAGPVDLLMRPMPSMQLALPGYGSAAPYRDTLRPRDRGSGGSAAGRNTELEELGQTTQAIRATASQR